MRPLRKARCAWPRVVCGVLKARYAIGGQVKYTNRYGLPEAFVEKAQAKQEKRFWSKVDVRGENECWPWTATRDENGYGHIYFFGKITKASRASYVLANGPIPAKGVIMHSCDNPTCVNPRHLSCGTQLDNVRDCAAKGRRANLKGSAHGNAILDEETVNAIRNANSTGAFSFAELGRAFGIRKGLVFDICYRRIWRHI